MHKKMNIMLTLILLLTTIFSCEKAEEQITSLSITPDTLIFQAEGGTADLQVLSNSAWTISINSDWCTTPILASKNDSKVTITVSNNTTSEARSSIISFSANDLKRQVNITQMGVTTTPVDTIEIEIPGDLPYEVNPDQTGMRSINAATFVQEMKAGWNIGNSLDAVGGETKWGNPLITQRLIDSVKAAGFNAVRIPIAWSKFSDETNFVIDDSWLMRVEEVVNYVLNNEMYAIINIHWDGGWMQPTNKQQEYVNNRLEIMWRQIAVSFRDYGDHLLFAGTNEVMVEGNYASPSKEYYTVQNSFNQTFVTTVRQTGGKNVFRYLVVQGFNTNIDYTINFAVMPTDVVLNRLLMEVHYYDPYNFTLNENSKVSQWGKIATDATKTETWANESYTDNQFNKMKTKFVDKGIPVIIGEYGAIARTTVADHAAYREYYMSYVTHSIYSHGLTPFYWDNGYTGNNSFGLFDRNTGKQAYPIIIKAIMDAVK